MKIGIITFHNALNAGAVLQAYALQTFLVQLGHEAEFIDYCPPRKFHLRDFLAKSPKTILNKLENFYYYRKYSSNNSFNRILKLSPIKFFNYNDLKQNLPNYDVVIAGSDQIWNFHITLSPIYLLSFVPTNKRKIAYAASLGQCHIDPSIYNEFREALSKFDAISVREKNGAEFIAKLLNNKIPIYHTVDPTLLISKEQYQQIIEKRNTVNNKHYLCTYILAELDNDNKKIISYIKNTLRLNIINVRNPDTCIKLKRAQNIIVTPTQWLYYITNSDFVICCSFHAVVFSILFHKPFIVLSPPSFKNQGGNMRINSFLYEIGLSDYIINTFDQNKIDSLIRKKIDWNKIETILAIKKEYSTNFIIKNLNT